MSGTGDVDDQGNGEIRHSGDAAIAQAIAMTSLQPIENGPPQGASPPPRLVVPAHARGDGDNNVTSETDRRIGSEISSSRDARTQSRPTEKVDLNAWSSSNSFVLKEVAANYFQRQVTLRDAFKEKLLSDVDQAFTDPGAFQDRSSVTHDDSRFGLTHPFGTRDDNAIDEEKGVGGGHKMGGGFFRSSLHEVSQSLRRGTEHNPGLGESSSKHSSSPSSLARREGTKNLNPSPPKPKRRTRASIAASHNVHNILGNENRTGFALKLTKKERLHMFQDRYLETEKAVQRVDEEELEVALHRKMRKQKERNAFYIVPDGGFDSMRKKFIIFLAIFTGVWLPVFLVMDITETRAVLGINCTIDFFFISNLIINFFVAMREQDEFSFLQDGELITDLHLIAQAYTRGRFWLDLITAIPWDVIYLITGFSGTGLQLLRCLRLIRLKDSSSFFASTTNTGMLLRQLAVLFASGHYAGVLWWATAWCESFPQDTLYFMYGGMYGQSQGITYSNHRQSASSDASSLIPVFVGDRFRMSRASFSGFIHNYAYMLFWGLKNTTAFASDAIPSSLLQTLLLICVIFIGLLAVSHVLGAIFEVISSLSKKSKDYRDHVQEVASFVKMRNVDNDLRARILAHRRLKQEWYHGVDEETLLSQLPDTLRKDVVCRTRSHLFMANIFFRKMSPGFIASICNYLSAEIFVALEIIITAGEAGSKMYFINSGVVDVIRKGTNDAMAVLKKGDFFGEISLITGIPRTAHVQSSCITELYALDKERLMELTHTYPVFEGLLIEVAGERVKELREKAVERDSEESVDSRSSTRWNGTQWIAALGARFSLTRRTAGFRKSNNPVAAIVDAKKAASELSRRRQDGRSAPFGSPRKFRSFRSSMSTPDDLEKTRQELAELSRGISMPMQSSEHDQNP